ncbi:MAG TPA: MBL fold metallo-hydrolase [Stellaceae bacterium]|nr:MBL fold metallo-hydrolase [Stellaceae bacterium]
MATWSLGPITVTRIEELLGPANVPPDQYLLGYDRALVDRHRDWLVPNHYAPAQDRLVTSIHAWLIRTGWHTILLDCCAGNHKNRPFSPRFHRLETPFLERLAAAGARPEDIDIVLCTHLHADHVGWNTVLKDGAWVPTFPRARYLFSRTESLYWDATQNPAMRSDPRREAYDDSVLPVVARGQAELVDGAHALDDGITIEPAPGHTPGHVMLKIAAAGAHGVFCGDAIHHPLQVYAPHWNHAADEQPAEAALTRRRVLEHCAERQAWLFPTHFGAPHVVVIKDAPDGFAARFIAGRDG